MRPSNTPRLPVGRVLQNGLAGFRAGGGALIARAAVLMAVPTAVLLVRLAIGSYWTNLALWILALVLAGYAAWPISGPPWPPSRMSPGRGRRGKTGGCATAS